MSKEFSSIKSPSKVFMFPPSHEWSCNAMLIPMRLCQRRLCLLNAFHATMPCPSVRSYLYSLSDDPLSGTRRTLTLLFCFPQSPPLLLHPLDSFQFFLYLLPLKWDLVRVFLLGPKVGDGEAIFEIRAEIVHPADREHDVHTKLQDFEI